MTSVFLVSIGDRCRVGKQKMYRPVPFDICGILPTARSGSTSTLVRIIIKAVEQRYCPLARQH